MNIYRNNGTIYMEVSETKDCQNAFLITIINGKYKVKLDKKCIPQLIVALLQLDTEQEISDYLKDAQDKFIVACKLSF